MKGIKKFWICFIVVIVALALVVGGLLFSIFNGYYGDSIGIIDLDNETKNSIKETENVVLNDTDLTEIEGGKATNSIYRVAQKNPDVINILLVGMDARSYETVSRSDSILVASYNRKTHKVTVTSFLRDIWVHMPEHGNGKLNSATAYGGVGLLVNTLNDNFDLDIQHYVQIRFEEFIEVVDIIGGIDVELTKAEINYINNKLHTEDRDYKNDIKAEPGIVHLNGTQALWHCRNRSIGNSDFTRTERQREVLEILLNKALTMSLPQITQTVYSMKDHVDTNVPVRTIIGLARDALIAKDVTFESCQVPFDGSFEFGNRGGMSVILLDEEETKDKLHYALGYITKSEVETDEEVINGNSNNSSNNVNSDTSNKSNKNDTKSENSSDYKNNKAKGFVYDVDKYESDDIEDVETESKNSSKKTSKKEVETTVKQTTKKGIIGGKSNVSYDIKNR